SGSCLWKMPACPLRYTVLPVPRYGLSMNPSRLIFLTIYLLLSTISGWKSSSSLREATSIISCLNNLNQKKTLNLTMKLLYFSLLCMLASPLFAQNNAVVVWQPSHQTNTGVNFSEAAVCNAIAEAAMNSGPKLKEFKVW